MVKSLLTTGFASPTFTSDVNTTDYWTFIGWAVDTTTESNTTRLIQTAGSISRLHIKLDANSVNTATVFTLRKNTTDTALAISVATGQTGTFQDISNTVSIVAGDSVNLKSVPGTTGTFTLSYYTVVFTPTDRSICMSFLGAMGNFSTGTGASTRYYKGNSGLITSTAPTEADQEYKLQIAGTLKNLAAKVETNSRATTTTAEVRKNGVSQSLALTWTSTQTGEKSNTANPVSVVDNDLINFSILNGTGSSAIVWNRIYCDYETAAVSETAASLYVTHHETSATIARNITRYAGACGRVDFTTTTESVAQMEMPDDGFTAKGMGVKVVQNSLGTGTSTVNFRKNAANSGITTSIGANATGWFEDTTNSIALVEADKVDYQVITSSAVSGTLNIRTMGIHLEATNPVVTTTVTGKAIATKQIIHG